MYKGQSGLIPIHLEEGGESSAIIVENNTRCPSIGELSDYVSNPVFIHFCSEMERRYGTVSLLSFSSCSWEKGWNIKFRKAGRSLCTLYVREGFFTVLIVIGEKERSDVERILPQLPQRLREIYLKTPSGNGQKWLMIDVEDEDEIYHGVFSLLDIRRKSGRCKPYCALSSVQSS